MLCHTMFGHGSLEASLLTLCFPEHVRSLLSLISLHCLPAELFNAFDSDRNGSVDFSELASGLTMLCGTTEADRAQFMFKLLDTNGDGTVSLEVCTLVALLVLHV